jgi:hypothetical protein
MPGEPTVEDLAQELTTNRSIFATRTDYNHRRRRQQGRNTLRLGMLLACDPDSNRRIRWLNGETQKDDSILESRSWLVPRIVKGCQHASIGGQNLGSKARNPSLPSRGGKMFQQY